MGSEEEKEAKKKFSRREALKRIALTTGSIGLLGSLHSWANPKSGDDGVDVNHPDQRRAQRYYSYSSYSRYIAYNRYNSTYYSYRSTTYYSYVSTGYSSYNSYRSTAYSSYISFAPGTRGGGCTRSD